jgi:hypothetical protein
MPDAGACFRGKKVFLVRRKKKSIAGDGSKDRELARSMTTAPLSSTASRPSPVTVLTPVSGAAARAS